MNKIYKVVWSKVKHCYVVTSELAKRNGKGCGARSLRMAAVSMGVAAALIGGFGTPVAEATYVQVNGTYYAYSGGDWGSYYSVDNLYWNPSGKSLTVTATTTDDLGNAMTVDSMSVTGSDSISAKKGRRMVIGNVSYGSADGTRVIVSRWDSGKGGKLTIGEEEKQIYLNPGSAASYGAHGSASGYNVTIDMGSSGSVYSVYGGISTDKDVIGNTVNVKSGVMTYVTGGYNPYGSTGGNANQNTVTISGGQVDQQIHGGDSGSGNANNNTVKITGGTVRNVTGGAGGDNGTGQANGNTVTVSGNSVVTGIIYGAEGSDETKNNTVTINGATVGYVTGAINYGFSTNPIASLNQVTVKGSSQVTGDVYGGRDGYGTAVITDNTVTIDGSAVVNGNIAGGFGWSKDKTENKVFVKSGSVTGDVYGGWLNSSWDDETGNVDNNEVHISGGKVTGIVHGGAIQGAMSGEIKGNKVEITGGEVTKEVYGGLSSSTSANNVDGNSVSISNDATVGSYVYGGKIDWDKSGTVTNNSVTMSGGTVAGLYGGYSRQAHGTGTVSDNTVEMTGGMLSGYGYIVGGYSTENYTTEDPTKVDVKNNIVKVTGDVDFKTSVVGGWAQGQGIVQNNRVEFAANNVDHYGEGEFVASVTGGKGGSGGATDNKVIFSKGKVYSLTGGSSNGMSGDLKGDVLQNTVEMSGGMVYGRITGGDSGYGKAENNTVTISKGSVGRSDSDGTNAEISGGRSTPTIITFATVSTATGSGTACHNTVTLSDGTFTGVDIRGGFVRASALTMVADTTATATGTADTNTVTVSGGTFSGNVNIYGGYGYSEAQGKGKATATVTVENNTATISGGTFSGNVNVYGGYGESSTDGEGTLTASVAVENNQVSISGGELKGNVYGGYNALKNVAGNVKGNKVEITGGTIDGKFIYGGYGISNSVGGDGENDGNKVIISNNAVVKSAVLGGYSYTGAATGNSVTISGGEAQSTVYGGYGESGLASNNSIEITGGKVGVTGNTQSLVYGGYSGSGDTTENKVTISNGTVGESRSAQIFGGYAPKGAADTNEINISGCTVGKSSYSSDIFGGHGKTSATGNTLNISGGSLFSSAYGGFSYSGAADNNIVNITGSTGLNWVYGSRSGISASNNKVTVSGGTPKYIYGGGSTSNTGTVNANEVTIKGSDTIVSSADGGVDGAENNGNKVLIDGSTVNNAVRGGSSSGGGSAMNNEVTVNNATVKGNVFGGNSHKGTISKNTVTINNSAIGGNVYGGNQYDNESGADYSVTDNIVTINGGTFTADKIIYGAFTYSGTTTDNTVNLTGSTTGLEGVEVYGGSQSANTGNELHVGGTRAYNASGEYVTKSGDVWQDSSNNAVKKVANFEIIALHSVKWDTSVAALEATTVENVNTLDIKNMQFDQTPPNGESMALLKSGSDLGASGVGIGLAYKDGSTEKTATSADLAKGVTFDSGALADTAVNGVTLSGTQSKKVSLEDSNKEIRYSFSSAVTDITIATDTFTAGGTAREFGSGDNLTGATITNSLAFKDASKKNMESGQKMVILDATKAVAVSGATLPAFTAQTYDVDFSDAISGKVVTLSGTHTDNLALNSAKTQLIYTVGDKNVNKAAFSGEVAWDNSQAYYTADAQYKFGTLDVDAENLKVTGTVTNALKKGDAMTLLSAQDMTATLAKDQSDENKKASKISVNYSDTASGVTFAAEATGEVKAATNAVNYEISGVSLESVKLASWDGKTASAVPTGWTLADKATVDTKDMSEPTAAATIITSGTDDFFKAATISGGKEYKETDFSEKDSGITFAGKQAKGVKAEGKNLVYAVGGKNVTTATMTGEIKWNTEKAYYTNTKYAFTDSAKTDISAVKFTATADPLNQSMTLIKNNVAGTVTEGTPEFTVNLSNTSLSATAKGEATVADGNLTYKVTDVELKTVTVNGVGGKTDEVPEDWTTAENLAVDTDKMELPADMPAAGEEVTILEASGTIKFSDDNISGDYKYGENPDRFTEKDKIQGAVVITGQQKKGVAAGEGGKSLVYKVGAKDVSSVSIGTVTWESGVTLLNASDKKAYNYAGVTSLEGSFAMNYEKPVDVAAKQSMTLLKANETLKDVVKEETKTTPYNNVEVAPGIGVFMNGNITGKLSKSGNNIVFTATENKASKLTFTDVTWDESTPLMTRPANIIFAGAAVDTSNITFKNIDELEADKQMTLVSDFGDTMGDRIGSKYKVGTGLEGEGEASLYGKDLIFTARTGVENITAQEQTHKTVMAMTAGVALLAGGNEHIGKALAGLGDKSNQGADGTSVGVSLGGSGNRYETGSHVNVNSWNAALAIGAKRELKQGSLEYGVFGEYGKGSYKLYNDDGGKGDGDAHYAGGGLMAKWTNSRDVYAEASFRLGRMSDSASSILEDAKGNTYGYNVHANYYGGHVGVGKVFSYKGGRSLDVYGKYFYTKRDGVNYNAGGEYKLDAVASSVLRIGARYGTTDKLWNWYGGLAYEYEFDGEATGTVNGVAIRAASIKGSSVRGELGMKMSATKDNPWQADISIYGYGGKHRGFGGNVNVVYTF